MGTRKRNLWIFGLATLSFVQCIAGSEDSSYPGVAHSTDRYHPTRLIVRFRDESIKQTGEGIRVLRALPLVSGMRIIQVDNSSRLMEKLSAYRNDPTVLYAEPDYKLRILGSTVPNDPQFGNLYGLHNTGQSSGRVDADIDAPEAWSIHTGSRSTVVAVIDSGIDYNHPDLSDNMWRNSQEIAGNGKDDDGNGYVDDVFGYDFGSQDADPTDDVGHGTHVAGTIGAAGNNGIGVVGVNWAISLMALKVADDNGNFFVSNAIEAINYAVKNNARISNNSWGGPDYSQSLMDAVEQAHDAGHIFVAAAGNDGTDNDVIANYPSNFSLDNVVAVAASDRTDSLASFSCYGNESVHLAAPGVSTTSTIPGSKYAAYSGTSMATPHVVGAMALLWDRYPILTYSEVVQQILQNGDRTGTFSGKTKTERRLNVYNALHAPGAPSSVAALVISPSEIELSWDKSGGESGFRVERTATADKPSSWVVLSTVASGTSTYRDRTVIANTTYHYRVRANKSAGDFAYSEEIATKASAPEAPTDLSIATNGMSQLDLHWRDRSINETAFRIERASQVGGPYTEVGKTSPNASSFSDAALSPGTTYYYRVGALNAVGESLSGEIGGATMDQDPQSGAREKAQITSLAPCPFAFAFHGTPEAEKLKYVRAFRDRILAATAFGRLSIKAYYAAGPTIVAAMAQSSFVGDIVRGLLSTATSAIHYMTVRSGLGRGNGHR